MYLDKVLHQIIYVYKIKKIIYSDVYTNLIF